MGQQIGSNNSSVKQGMKTLADVNQARKVKQCRKSKYDEEEFFNRHWNPRKK